MRTFLKTLSLIIAGSFILLSFPQRALAQVSQSDFDALKKMVQDLNDKMQKLEQSHDQDQKTHAQDQQEIQRLKSQLLETTRVATNAEQKAEAAASAVPAVPVPGPAATHNFTMVGDAEVQFGKVHGQHSGFVLADFAPIFLFRARDNILFEAGFDINLSNGNQGPGGGGSSTDVNLSFAQLDYLWNDYVTVVAGDMLLPLGTYSERAAGWLNKIPDDPLARDVLPGSGVGVQLRGAVPIGLSGQHIAYSAYGVNGPSSTDGTGNSGSLDLGGNVGDTGNWHANPSGGGRVGWFYPWKAHYDFELGLSGQAGEWDNAGKRLWSTAVLDASVHVSPFVEVKGEYIHTWQETDDVGTIKPRGWWIQAGYKLAGLGLEVPVVNDLELVGRYDYKNDTLGTKTDRYTVGYVWYITNTLWFEGDYEILLSRGPNALPPNNFVFQLSYGF